MAKQDEKNDGKGKNYDDMTDEEKKEAEEAWNIVQDNNPRRRRESQSPEKDGE
jgi:hypothetical protein